MRKDSANKKANRQALKLINAEIIESTSVASTRRHLRVKKVDFEQSLCKSWKSSLSALGFVIFYSFKNLPAD